MNIYDFYLATHIRRYCNLRFNFFFVVSISSKGVKINTEEEKDTSCGIGFCRPKWMQKFVHPVPFLVIYSLLGMVQGLLWSYYVGVFTTLERRYSYKSKVTAFISLSDNIGIIVASLLIGYFGGNGHRPRWIAAGMIIAALGALLSASPYWIFGTDRHLAVSSDSTISELFPSDLCQLSNNGTEHCQKDNEGKLSETVTAVALVISGNIVNGMGLTAFYIVGAPYLDDNIKKTKTPLYFGVMYAVRLLGPALGFFLASATLQFYENPTVHPGFGQKDPRWVGAWWLGFVFIAGILTIFSVILCSFPRKLKWNGEEINEKSVSISHLTISAKSTKDKLKDLLFTIGELLKNKLLMFRFVGECLNLLGTLGFVLFMPKYLESQFRQGASEASQMAGMAGTLFMVVGFILSAAVIWKLKPSPRTVAVWITVTGVFNAAALIAAGSINCHDQQVVTNSCQEDCHCSLEQFSPVCYQNITYFSSCFVGCKSSEIVNNTKIYTDCSCTNNDYAEDQVVQGFCPSSCSVLPYLVILIVSNLFASTSKIGGLLITLRCVKTSQKSIALAISSIMLCFFEDDFRKLEKSVQDKLINKVSKAVDSLKSLADNFREIEKVFPADCKVVKGKLTTFIAHVEKLVEEAKQAYKDKEQAKTFAMAYELMKTTYTLSEVESALKSVRPLVMKMAADHLKSAKSSLEELENFLKSITHITTRSLSTDADDVEKLISNHAYAKIMNAYKQLKNGLVTLKQLSKQVPEVYKNIKTELPKLEKTLKSLLADSTAAAKDKKKGDTIMTMIKVGEAGVKLAELTSIVNKIKPELSGVLKEVTGPAKSAVKEVQDLLKLVKHI
ncbi:Solute carrier organic anion transporter family member 5A1 [Nymphon striatum]|nr:Solute carrier organic anion transporter family member 5A1 [Nymphon striatum]